MYQIHFINLTTEKINKSDIVESPIMPEIERSEYNNGVPDAHKLCMKEPEESTSIPKPFYLHFRIFQFNCSVIYCFCPISNYYWILKTTKCVFRLKRKNLEFLSHMHIHIYEYRGIVRVKVWEMNCCTYLIANSVAHWELVLMSSPL